ncbi:histidine phosphatase family protein [Shimia abyssi]|uniref:Broad specificity phosphatase PhoE n=1 Tax=Shimia abyssi TaxID=1662395 RepID=A0A2P8FE29_9RHOB|nr:histidine phosphatase family protein [Shimia abyssi]PSL19974.1 broad specificity phosphatase PhoE [Shimia abyssi]
MRAIYLSHPEVTIDPNTPVPDWSLSQTGRARTSALATSGALRNVTRIFSSAERKAVETATLLAFPLGLIPVITDAMHENDRSSTGFLPPDQFNDAADAFFAEPDLSYRGWETAAAAQSRIHAAVASALSAPTSGDALFVGHGGVGTLLYCALSKQPISRAHDQANTPGANPGGGNVFIIKDSVPTSGWHPMEALVN